METEKVEVGLGVPGGLRGGGRKRLLGRRGLEMKYAGVVEEPQGRQDFFNGCGVWNEGHYLGER